MCVGRRSQDDLNYSRMAWEAERRKVERLDHQSFKSRVKKEKQIPANIKEKRKTLLNWLANTIRRMSDCRQYGLASRFPGNAHPMYNITDKTGAQSSYLFIYLGYGGSLIPQCMEAAVKTSYIIFFPTEIKENQLNLI